MTSELIDYREHDKNFWYELEEWVPKESMIAMHIYSIIA